MKHFIYFAIARAISQIKYRVFKKEGVTKGAFQLSLCGYFCSVSLGELRVVSMTYQPSGTDGQLRHSPLLLPTVPLNCRHRYQWCPAKSFPPQHHCAPDPTEIPRDRGGCPVTAAGSLESWNPRTSQEVTAEEEQSPYNKTLKTSKARALKALSEHCEWKL